MKIKTRKTENQASTEFKYFENNQLYGTYYVTKLHPTLQVDVKNQTLCDLIYNVLAIPVMDKSRE